MASDLSLFERLSRPELIAEARRRGIPDPESMDRDALLAAIRAREPRSGGPLSRARALIGRVVDTVRAALPGTERRSDRPPPFRPQVAEPTFAPERPLPPVLSASASALLGDPAFCGVRLVEDGALALVWRVAGERLDAARVLAPDASEIRARTVRVRWPAGAAEPTVERLDHGGLRDEGVLALSPRMDGERIVASIGLGGGAIEFVSIEHATRP